MRGDGGAFISYESRRGSAEADVLGSAELETGYWDEGGCGVQSSYWGTSVTGAGAGAARTGALRVRRGILSFWVPRAKREPCRRGVSVGDRGSKPAGRPAMASAKRWKSVASPKVSVGDTHVCGRGAPERDSRAVDAEGEADSGKVEPLRGGGGDGAR